MFVTTVGRRFGRGATRRDATPLSEKALRDHEPLDFARALADGAELYVPVELLDGKVLDEAVTAVDLDGALGRAHGDLGRVELRLCGKPGDFFSRVLGGRRPLREQARGV